MALLGPCGMSDLSPQGGAKRTFDQARAHLVMCESANYTLTCHARIPSARHRQWQARFKAALAGMASGASRRATEIDS
jgi:hypothetical protein